MKRILALLLVICILTCLMGITPALADRKAVCRVKVIYGSNVRSGPSTEYEKIGYAYDNEVFPCYGERNGWYLIRLDDGKEGFVSGTRCEILSGTMKKVYSETFTFQGGVCFGMPLDEADTRMKEAGWAADFGSVEEGYLEYSSVSFLDFDMTAAFYDWGSFVGTATALDGVTAVFCFLYEGSSDGSSFDSPIVEDYESLIAKLSAKYGQQPLSQYRDWGNTGNAYIYTEADGACRGLMSLHAEWLVDDVMIIVENRILGDAGTYLQTVFMPREIYSELYR